MFILENVPLGSYSTMRLGGTAAFLTDINGRDEIAEAVQWAETRGLPCMMIGSGSNIIWDDDGYPGLVMVNKILGYQTYDMDETNVYVTVGAGENWDQVVARTVEAGLTGIEALSLIPGTAGATPVQNVGAYGREISNCIVTLEAYDKSTRSLVTLRGSECNFGYRTSRFKKEDKGRFFISALTMLLQRGQPTAPFYDSVQSYFQAHDITDYTSAALREAVVNIRNSKLPDPAIVANNGSFFANPIITADKLHELQDSFADIPHWQAEPGYVKLAAGWLIEQAGFKGYHDTETGMATWDKQALVIVNESAQHTSDLKLFRQKILDAVNAKFGIVLEQEPELI